LIGSMRELDAPAQIGLAACAPHGHASGFAIGECDYAGRGRGHGMFVLCHMMRAAIARPRRSPATSRKPVLSKLSMPQPSARSPVAHDQARAHPKANAAASGTR